MFDSETRLIRSVHIRHRETWCLVTSAVVVSLFCSGCQLSGSTYRTARDTQQLRLEIPQAKWEPIFFQRIDELAKVAALASLRSAALPDDDLEARFWVEAGYFGMDGIVLRKASGKWTGIYLHGFSKEANFKKYAEELRVPQSGWDTAWQRLVDAGLLSMPDASQVQCNVNGLDGAVFIVETNVNKTYRTYLYDNPAFAKCEHAQRMITIVKIIDQEFGLHWPTTN